VSQVAVATIDALIDQTAGMRFNPPPNWPPAPPNWTPPPGWQPDPAWPPLPPGWPLWVPDAPRRKPGLVIGALAAALFIVVGGVVAIVATTRTPDITVTPTSTTKEAKSDEDQVRDVVDQFEQAWNDEDVDELRQLFCADMRSEAEFDERALREMIGMGGNLSLTIAELDINGDAATATVLNRGEDPDDIGFAREDGDWKWCEL
jgi:hypothetical protein